MRQGGWEYFHSSALRSEVILRRVQCFAAAVVTPLPVGLVGNLASRQ